MITNANGNHKEMMAKLRAETEAIQASTKAMRDKMMEANMKDDREETTACQDAMEANLKKMESNMGEKEAIVKWEEISNEEVTP
jgi:hypothetical protein